MIQVNRVFSFDTSRLCRAEFHFNRILDETFGKTAVNQNILAVASSDNVSRNRNIAGL